MNAFVVKKRTTRPLITQSVLDVVNKKEGDPTPYNASSNPGFKIMVTLTRVDTINKEGGPTPL